MALMKGFTHRGGGVAAISGGNLRDVMEADGDASTGSPVDVSDKGLTSHVLHLDPDHTFQESTSTPHGYLYCPEKKKTCRLMGRLQELLFTFGVILQKGTCCV